MSIYAHSATQATRPAFSTSSAKHRADFARSAVYEDFRSRDARAIDYGGFRDRQPNEAPRRTA